MTTPPYTAAEALPAAACPPSLEMRHGLSGDEVNRRLAGASRHGEIGQRVLAFYLVEMDARRLYQSTGHGSTAHYAEARLELDRRRTAELLRVGRKLLELREVDRAFCEGRIGWSKVLLLARMASPEHEAAWLERALTLDARALALLASRSKEGGPPRKDGDQKGLPEIRFPVAASLGALTHAKLEQAQRRLGAELGREVDLASLLDTLLDEFLATPADGTAPGRKRLDASLYRVVLLEPGDGGPLAVESDLGPVSIGSGDGDVSAEALSEAVRCDAGVRNVGVPNGDVPNGDRHDHRAHDVKTPVGMRVRVLLRDRLRCRSCRSRHRLMVHHIEFRSHGGRTHAENLLTVCSTCHGLIHAGLLAIEGANARRATFVNAAREPLAGPLPVGSAAACCAAAEPIAPPPPSAAAADGPGRAEGPERAQRVEGLVTLESVPAEVDATWWRAHAHLVRDRGEHGALRFEPGTARGEIAGDAGSAQVAAEGATTPAADAFAGLVGQDERVSRLRSLAEGSRARGKRFPHTLFTGPAGTGKSTLARAVAATAGRSLVEVSAPLLTDRAAWIRLLAGLPDGCHLFLDEAHALPRPLLDALLEALSEGRLTLVLSDGQQARSVTLKLARFTLIAATTDEGALPPALRSRFGLRETLVHFTPEALSKVVREAALAQGRPASEGAARRLARASRGTPREALRLLDLVLTEGAARPEAGQDAELDVLAVGRSLANLGYDADDLDPQEQRYLAVLRQSPVPVPLSRLSRLLGTTPRTLVEHVEPWLFSRGLVRMALGGRVAGPYARRAPGPSRYQTASGAPNVRRGLGGTSATP